MEYQPQPSGERATNIDQLLGGQLRNMTNEAHEISGNNYIRLFREAHNHGFTDEAFKGYLKQQGININSNQPPEEPIQNTRLS